MTFKQFLEAFSPQEQELAKFYHDLEIIAKKYGNQKILNLLTKDIFGVGDEADEFKHEFDNLCYWIKPEDEETVNKLLEFFETQSSAYFVPKLNKLLKLAFNKIKSLFTNAIPAVNTTQINDEDKEYIKIKMPELDMLLSNQEATKLDIFNFMNSFF